MFNNKTLRKEIPQKSTIIEDLGAAMHLSDGTHTHTHIHTLGEKNTARGE